jgi:hypothetical protein
MSATNRKSLIGHHYRKHRSPPEPAVDTNTQLDAMDALPPTDEQVVDDSNFQWAETDESHLPTHPCLGDIPNTTVPANAFHMFTHGPIHQFFEDLQNSTFVAAVQHLVARTCYQNAGLQGAAVTGITVNDLCFFLVLHD